MKTIELPFVKQLENSLSVASPLIQVVLGPRQVGKTTGIQQLLSKKKFKHAYYTSADGEISKSSNWIIEQWSIAKSKDKNGYLIIDEIQKVENWSEAIKQLWDRQSLLKEKLKVILLGSSSLAIQRGLKESLTGRFEIHKVFHWNYQESLQGYGLELNEFLKFGGYPGSYSFMRDKVKWINYVQESIIDTVIGKDILTVAKVKSPALFKQAFEIACSYPAQEISYTKLLGQLQDKGNTDLIKYYLEQFEGAFLIKQLFKYSNKKVLTRSSSPMLLPMCPSLYSIGLDCDLNSEEIGRSFELAVGSALCRLPGKLYYWRERNFEVDFVYQFGKRTVAIEVKSGRKKTTKGLEKFLDRFPNSSPLVITPENFDKLNKLI